MTDNFEELKSCPFCGSTPVWACDEDETEIYMFDSIAERAEFLEMVNK